MYRFGFARVSILQSGRCRLSNHHPNASPRPDMREEAAKSGSPSEFRPPRHRIRQKGRPMPAYAGAGAASGENRTSQGGTVCSEARQRTARQDRDAATARPRLRQELCASRLAFTLSRTGTSKEDYCRAVGISSSTLSRILNRQTLMSTSTLIETARYFEDTSVSWFLGL